MSGGRPENEGGGAPASPPSTAPARRVLLFALAALCFLLPFGTVSCGDENVQVTGVQLVSKTVPGADYELDEFGDESLADEVERGGFLPATLALLAVFAGLALAALAPQALGKMLLITFGGIVALVALPAKAIVELADVTLGPGYVTALGLELWLAGDCVLSLVRRRWGWPRPRPAHARRPRKMLPPGAVPLDGDENRSRR